MGTHHTHSGMTLDTIDFDKKSMKGTDDGTAEALGR
jgi:hypothetical protein